MTSREEVYKAISSERDYQEAKWPKGTGCMRSIGEEILCIEECLLVARKTWQESDDSDPGDVVEMLNHIRKVAGVAVRCMEIHGAPLR